jgi:hypothetical protein
MRYKRAAGKKTEVGERPQMIIMPRAKGINIPVSPKAPEKSLRKLFIYRLKLISLRIIVRALI